MWRQDLAGPVTATMLLVLMTYVAGRIHQFFKQTQEREQAFRDGYNLATRALFGLATRVAGAGAPTSKAPLPKPMVGFASVPENKRHPLPARHRANGRRKPSLADTEKMSVD